MDVYGHIWAGSGLPPWRDGICTSKVLEKGGPLRDSIREQIVPKMEACYKDNGPKGSKRLQSWNLF